MRGQILILRLEERGTIIVCEGRDYLKRGNYHERSTGGGDFLGGQLFEVGDYLKGTTI